MKSKTFKLSIAAFLLIALSACQKEDSANVNQDRIFAAYELFFNENENTTTATAIFTFGNRTGTRLTLSEGSTVTFDGEQMAYDQITGAYLSETAGYKASGTFVFEDLDTGIFTNSVNLTPIAFSEEVPLTLDRSQSHEIGWVGDVVTSDRSFVSATVVPNNLEQTKVFIQNDAGADTVILTSDKLSEIDPQPAELFLERTTESVPAEASSAGGVVIARYRPMARNIQVE